MRRRKTLAPKELQVEGAKPSGGSYSQIVGVRANDKFVDCRSGVRIPAVAFSSVPPRRSDASTSPHFLAPPESIDPTRHDEERRIEHIRPEADHGIEERE